MTVSEPVFLYGLYLSMGRMDRKKTTWQICMLSMQAKVHFRVLAPI